MSESDRILDLEEKLDSILSRLESIDHLSELKDINDRIDRYNLMYADIKSILYTNRSQKKKLEQIKKLMRT